MNDDILRDIHQQLTEINKKAPNIPWRMVRIVGSIFVVILLTVPADMLYDAISDWRKKPADSWDAVERLANRADLAQAYDMALRLEQEVPMDWTAAYHKGDLLVQMRKLDLALAEFQKAYQVFPNDRLKGAQGTDTSRRQLKRKWGDKIAFWGCLGSQSTIPRGTPAEIRGEIRRLRTEMARGGGFILAPAKPLQPETPTANAVAVLEAFTERTAA